MVRNCSFLHQIFSKINFVNTRNIIWPTFVIVTKTCCRRDSKSFLPKPSLKVRRASAIFWDYLGMYKDYGQKICEISWISILNRCWKFQFPILKNKKVLFLKKIFFWPYRQDTSKRWRVPSQFSRRFWVRVPKHRWDRGQKRLKTIIYTVETWKITYLLMQHELRLC